MKERMAHGDGGNGGHHHGNDHRHGGRGHHGHGHGHHHGGGGAGGGAGGYGRAFAIGTALNLGFVAVEGAAGFLSGSLALLADAGHNLGDVLSLLLAWGGAWLSLRRPTPRRTYGFRRSSILVALANAVILLIAVGAILLEAIRRFAEPEPAAGGIVMAVAGAGILVNAATAWLFAAGRHGDVNVRGAFLHMAADAAVSLAVVLAGLGIALTGRQWIDPAMSLLVAVVITVGTWRLLRESVNLALDAVPEGIDRDAVETYLARLPGVTEVHDLHIWGMSTTETALTAHLVRPAAEIDDAFLARVGEELHIRFGIAHATVQIENGGEAADPCRLAPAHVV
jgi:cobalt-zinc-cadmium efflux system protein